MDTIFLVLVNSLCPPLFFLKTKLINKNLAKDIRVVIDPEGVN
jgi:hypothetical protein